MLRECKKVHIGRLRWAAFLLVQSGVSVDNGGPAKLESFAMSVRGLSNLTAGFNKLVTWR
jgi:hypothetical protein